MMIGDMLHASNPNSASKLIVRKAQNSPHHDETHYI
jgi:hypothetical protein